MSNLLLKNVLLNHEKKDVLIKGNRFSRIADRIADADPEILIDGKGRLAIIPPFYNAHTHAAMTLMRGYADDYELFRWLSEFIWPMENKLTAEDVYAGTRLAILEMIRSGTVFFNDMYWFQKAAVRASEEMGVRACIGMLCLSSNDKIMQEKLDNEEIWANRNSYSGRIQIAFAPHAIYTVNRETLARTAEQANAADAFIHIHVSETEKEVADCVKEHGMRPFEYLDSLGLLGPKTICAHSIHMSEHELEIAHERRSVLVHVPVSNMKLASGALPNRMDPSKNIQCRLALGTDGAASNNNLSMLEEMKFAALLAKHMDRNPQCLPAERIFEIATRGGAEAFGIDAGVIAEGRLADCVLIDLNSPLMVPDYHLISNLVYSADSSCVDTVICDGRVLMQNRRVEGESEIIQTARESAERLLKN